MAENIMKLPIDEVARRAAERVGPDDDWGMSLQREAQDELERRRRLKLEIEKQKDKIDYPMGHPLPSLERRLADLLRAQFGVVLETDPIIKKIIAEFGKKDPTKS